MMRFLLDANMPRCAVDLIRSRGGEAFFLRDMRLGNAPDSHVADLARKNQAILVTRDFDFSDIRSYPPAEFFGIIVLDMRERATATQICSLLEVFLDRPNLESELARRLAIVRHGRVRFRPRLDQ